MKRKFSIFNFQLSIVVITLLLLAKPVAAAVPVDQNTGGDCANDPSGIAGVTTVVGGFMDIPTPDDEQLTGNVIIHWNCGGPALTVPVVGYCIPTGTKTGEYGVDVTDDKGHSFNFGLLVNPITPGDTEQAAMVCTAANLAKHQAQYLIDNNLDEKAGNPAAAKTSTTNTTTTTPDKPSTEEQAVYNIQNGQTPDSINSEPVPESDNSIFAGIGQFFGSIGSFFTSAVGFISPPQQPKTLYDKSEKSNQVIVPDQIKLEIDKQPDTDRVKSYVGKNTGVYGADMPTLLDPSSNVQDYEKLYEQANFPDGIHPVTGQ